MSQAVQTRFRLLSVEQLLELTGWSLTTLNRRLVAGTFPQPIEGADKGRRKWTLAQYEKWAQQSQDEAERQ